MSIWDGQYAMHNAMTMNSVMPSVLVPHNFMVQENNTMNSNMKPPLPMIGPVLPVNQVETASVPITQAEVQCVEAESSTQNTNLKSKEHDQGSRDKRDRRDRNRDRRHRSRSHDRNERHGRGDRYDKRRHTNWDSDRERSTLRPEIPVMPCMPMGNMMMPGAMMSYNNMLPNIMPQQQMDVQMHMMPGMNVMPNMIDQNMMMNQSMAMPNQIIFSSGILLPPIPGTSVPSRRERPKGCRTVVVGGLPIGVTTDVVMEIFKRFGEIYVNSPRHGIFHVRFVSSDVMEQAFYLTGYRFKFHDQSDNEATAIFIDYAMNREDEAEYEKDCEQTPLRVEQFTSTALTAITDKIKSEEEFATSAPTLAAWLQRGECNKRNAHIFYSLIQVSNNQLRRLFNEKMQLDEEFQNLKSSFKERFARIVMQFELVAKILTAAKHQRVSDHFTKQQRRNVEMWLKMTEEVENIKEEFKTVFEDDEGERANSGKPMVTQEKYDELKVENENLSYELEGYKNEAFLAKDEAERKFEKFKAHFIAQQAMQNQKLYPPLPNYRPDTMQEVSKTLSPPPTTDDNKVITSPPSVPPTDAKLISILTAFLMVHPLGATIDYLVSYVRSMAPNVTQGTVLQILQKYTDVFECKRSGIGATIEHRWSFITFDIMKKDR
ncbi:ecto-NOX disulfide-thiol exchanger 2-like [Papilio machaon]|uniref:ecto-NOX disulfide-thiol exchanger 2-like n=1 Tax=Papilio machaon TaxID=76193 RepID=UPI001E663BD8|nr:ecto-NOX disulfide-thiol exchanger 2-like [Papilio machaon]XP_045539497.1 ecto-NOX disulfide-thiol exchanger 2-like [Papilio machaon]